MDTEFRNEKDARHSRRADFTFNRMKSPSADAARRTSNRMTLPAEFAGRISLK
jgi:hypothetical protein